MPGGEGRIRQNMTAARGQGQGALVIALIEQALEQVKDVVQT
jgi:hypothetical protein